MNEYQKCFYSVSEFAAKLGVNPNTVRIAIKTGRINALKMGGDKRMRYRIPYSEIDRLALIDVNQYLKKERNNG